MTTMVLELGNDMVELEAPIFITSETTVQAGELATGSIAVQVLHFIKFLIFIYCLGNFYEHCFSCK